MFVHSCSLESSMQLLQNVYAARQRKPNQCSDFYFPVFPQVAASCGWLRHTTHYAAAVASLLLLLLLLPVSIHLSSVTLGGTEAACEYLSESVALHLRLPAASATLPYLSPGSCAISVIILSFQLVCRIPATLQLSSSWVLRLFSRALIKAWQFYSSSSTTLQLLRPVAALS